MNKSELPWNLYSQTESNSLSDSWELSDPLFKFKSFSRPFTLDMALRGILIFGATGSGKSSSSGKLIASSYLKHGFGGLVLCAKGNNDELDNFKSISEQLNRADSLIEFGPKSEYKFTFNFLEFFRRLTNDSSENQANLVHILTLVANGLDREQKKSQDPFWDRVLEQYFTHLLSLAFELYSELTFIKIKSCFENLEQNTNSFLSQFTESTNEDVKAAVLFFLNEFAKLNEKTRSIVITSVSSMLFKFTIGNLKSMFGAEGNIDPTWILHGAVIVINVPTQEYQEIGRVSNLIWKYAFQKCCLTRNKSDSRLRPVFLWADEAQEFISPYDSEFQAMARSVYCSSVFLTQNHSLLRLKLGSGPFATDAVTALEGNMMTQIYHQNFDKETNALAQNKIGKDKIKSTSRTYKDNNYFGISSTTTIEKEEFIFQQQDFTKLRTGGHAYNRKCDAIVFTPGRKLFWPFVSYSKLTIHQRINHRLINKQKLRLSVNFKDLIKNHLKKNNEQRSEHE